jgi:hypothetical protein
LGDSALRAALTTNARHLVEQQYDWQKIGAQFVQVIEQTAMEKLRRAS